MTLSEEATILLDRIRTLDDLLIISNVTEAVEGAFDAVKVQASILADKVRAQEVRPP